MQYSNTKKNGGSVVPSLFSSGISNRNKTDGTSYLQKRTGKIRGTDRRKVNILALVDDAIEDGATNEAKQKASAERAASKSPVPAMRHAIPEKKLQSPRRRTKSSDKKLVQMQELKKVKNKNLDTEKDDNSVRSIRSLVRNSPKVSKSESPRTPAWKARLSKQGKNISNPLVSEENPSSKMSKTPKSRGTPKSGKRAVRKKSSEQMLPLELPLSHDEQPKGLAKKVKKEKKEKKKKKSKSKDNPSSHEIVVGGKKFSATDKMVDEGSDGSFNNDDVIFRNTHGPKKSDGRDTKVGSPLADKSIAHLRKNLEETQKQLKNAARVTKQALSDLEKEFVNTKETTRFRFMKDIHVQGKKSDVKYQAYKTVVDEKQKEIDDLRSANQKLRTTIQKLPKQMSEAIFSNHSLEEANEEVAGHIAGLELFDTKLQTDQDRLLQSNDKCKNQYLPRYRQQLWESGQHLESESKIKNLYRDCIIKITKQMEKSRQVDLVEEISSMVLETEGEVNPKFDPKFLSTENFHYDDSSSSDSDENDSSSSSSSSDSDYG